ncbi:hypothetical protein ACFX2G_021224 [Malus domestica]
MRDETWFAEYKQRHSPKKQKQLRVWQKWSKPTTALNQGFGHCRPSLDSAVMQSNQLQLALRFTPLTADESVAIGSTSDSAVMQSNQWQLATTSDSAVMQSNQWQLALHLVGTRIHQERIYLHWHQK